MKVNLVRDKYAVNNRETSSWDLWREAPAELRVVTPEELPKLDYLANQTMGDLLLAEADAVAATLAKNGRPVRIIRIPTVDERVMGALMMHFMLETMFAAELWGIDAFDQPEVEASKVLTRQYLSQRRKS